MPDQLGNNGIRNFTQEIATPSSVRRQPTATTQEKKTDGECQQKRTVLNMDVGEMTVRLMILSEIEQGHAKPESALKMPRSQIWRASKSPLLIDKGVKQD